MFAAFLLVTASYGMCLLAIGLPAVCVAKALDCVLATECTAVEWVGEGYTVVEFYAHD